MFGKKEISKIRAKRVNQILKEKGLSQKEFAAIVRDRSGSGLTGGTLSALLTNSRTFTDKAVNDIYKAFPEYRLEWLMGYDDYKTISDEAAFKLRKINDVAVSTSILLENAADSLAEKYDISRYNEMIEKINTVPDDCDDRSKLSEDVLNAVDDFDTLRTELKDFASFLVVRYVTAPQRERNNNKKIKRLVNDLFSK